MSSLILTITAQIANVRRGPSISTAIIREAKSGQQFDVVTLVDIGAHEQWAKVILPDSKDVHAYICTCLPNGRPQGSVSSKPVTSGNAADYSKGFADGVDHVLRWVASERAKLGG